jgi:ABC-2 type transport system ATP-binding protein
MPPAIEVHDLIKRYRQAEVNAVDGVSLTVPAGSFFALLGPNGAGKTTTISILTTTLMPTSGSVCVAGHDVVTEPADVRRNVGIIFQNPSLDLNLTAEENVRLHAVLYGLYGFRPTWRLMPAAYRQRVGELAELLGIQDDLFRPLRGFSGGMRRKLEIVRSLIHHPQVLFLDEPTSGLDPASRRDLWGYLRQMRLDEGTTVFLTTHYLDEAEGADAVTIINHGRVAVAGTPAEIKAALVDEHLEVDATDPAALRAELSALGFAVTDGPPPFHLPVTAAEAHGLLRRIQTPLSLVRTHSPTLEDAYLTLIGGDE